MKRSQLQELIEIITRSVLKEYISIDSETSDDNLADPSSPTQDEMTPAEKAKLEREKEMDRRDDIKQKQKELDVSKKEMEFQKQKIDQSKRFNIPNITRDIQRLKGAKI